LCFVTDVVEPGIGPRIIFLVERNVIGILIVEITVDFLLEHIKPQFHGIYSISCMVKLCGD
jgi:hypothetical protein